MLRFATAGLAVLLLISACGRTSTGSAQGPTAASVAVQPGDLPSDMRKCGVSGDINSFLNASKTKDPNIYTSIKTEWDAAQKDGATAAYIAFFSDSAAHCTSIGTNPSDVSSATYKLVVNFVLQFKDEASAAKGYASDNIFGFSASTLQGGGAPVQQGTATGLGANSVVLTVAVSNQAFYVALWQHKAFMVILLGLNIDAAASKKAAVAENGRIK